MLQLESVQSLTPKEKNVLEFIESYIEAQGFSPSFQEVKEHFGFASLNSVQNYIKQLAVSYTHLTLPTTPYV